MRPPAHEGHKLALSPNFERAREINRELHARLVTLQHALVAQLSAAPAPIDLDDVLERYAELTRLDATFSSEQRAFIRAEHRMLVQPAFLSVPLIRRSVDRPLGYPGDYLMVEMIFDDVGASDRTLAARLGQLVLDAAPSRAHRHRAPWSHAWLDQLASEQARPLRILSFACGPEVVLRRYVDAGARIEITLCDHEPRALQHAEARLTPSLPRGAVRSVQLSAVSLLRASKDSAWLLQAPEPRFDVVLVLGLFDYLRDGMVRRLMRAFHALLRPGGLCLTSNLNIDNPHRSLMEYIADWEVLHRNPDAFESLMTTDTGFATRELTADPSRANLLFAGRA
jgi:SAM-dependent methyltransferase